MSLSRSAIALLGAGILGLAGVGLGAGANFTDAVSATQSVTAGTMSVRVDSTNGDTSPDGKTVTLHAAVNEPSTFTAGPSTVTVTNTGNIPATEVQLVASAATNGASGDALLSQMYVKIFSSGQTFYNGLLSGLITGGPYDLGNGSLPDSFAVTFYAGGAAQPDGTNGHASALTPFTPASLSNSSEGGVVVPTITVKVVG